MHSDGCELLAHRLHEASVNNNYDHLKTLDPGSLWRVSSEPELTACYFFYSFYEMGLTGRWKHNLRLSRCFSLSDYKLLPSPQSCRQETKGSKWALKYRLLGKTHLAWPLVNGQIELWPEHTSESRRVKAVGLCGDCVCVWLWVWLSVWVGGGRCLQQIH